MKGKWVFLIAIALGIILIGLVFVQNSSHTRPNLTAGQIGDKGIYIGDRSKTTNILSLHERDAKIIHETGEYIRAGDSYEKDGRYELAAEEYQKAYSLDKGMRAVSGLLLATTYEKLGRYNDGITLIDQMIQNGELSANGVKNANEIKSRLLAAKQNQSQVASPS